jgi:hypothetical protein
VGKQIVLPWSKAFSIAVESLRVRLGRSLITASAIGLACAFLAFTFANHAFLKLLLSLNDPDVNVLLQKKGIDLEAGDPGLAAREIWLVATSMAVCLVGVSNALLMSVTERIKEIGTMKCLGALDSFIVKLFLIEALLMGTVSALAGMLAGLASCILANLGQFGRVAVSNAPWAQLFGGGMRTVLIGVVISVLAAIYPSVMAARMQPVEAMRKEV